MKTLKKGDKIVRVKDNETTRFLADGYSFCPKSEWKKTRGTKKEDVVSEKTEDVKKEVKRKRDKRK